MPANLPPEYHKIEAELRTARTPEEKIDIYERLIRVIPHHKGTDKLIAMYRQKSAKAREEGERRQATAKTHRPTRSKGPAPGRSCSSARPTPGNRAWSKPSRAPIPRSAATRSPPAPPLPT